MKFVFIGAGPIAAKCLRWVISDPVVGHELVGLVAPPQLLNEVDDLRPERRPRSYELSSTDRKEGDLVELIGETKPDCVISVQYPWILSEAAIRMAEGQVLNLHNARLPDYRGHNALSHEILNGERSHTSTFHWIAEEVDRGHEFITETIPIASDDTAYSLWLRSADACLRLFKRCLNDFGQIVETGGRTPIADGGHYYRKADIQKLKRIPEDATMAMIDRISRAFWFPNHEPAYFLVGDRKLYVMPHSFSYPDSPSNEH